MKEVGQGIKHPRTACHPGICINSLKPHFQTAISKRKERISLKIAKITLLCDRSSQLQERRKASISLYETIKNN